MGTVIWRVARQRGGKSSRVLFAGSRQPAEMAFHRLSEKLKGGGVLNLIDPKGHIVFSIALNDAKESKK